MSALFFDSHACINLFFEGKTFFATHDFCTFLFSEPTVSDYPVPNEYDPILLNNSYMLAFKG